MNETAVTRVEVGGAPLLDEVKPGWAEMVDLGNFDMAYGTECVVGQVFKDEWKVSQSGESSTPYLFGVVKLYNYVHPATNLDDVLTVTDVIRDEIRWERLVNFAISLGFDVPDEEGYGYTELEQAWEAEIQLRRNSLIDA